MPTGKDAYWFPHDSNARYDPKIMAMRTVYKTEGYGWYWMIIEMLREEPSHRLPYNDYTAGALAMQMQCDRTIAHQYLQDCIEKFTDGEGEGLFKTDGKWFWSDSLVRRMDAWDKRSEQAKQAAYMRWHSDRIASASVPQSVGNADAMQGEERRGEGKGGASSLIVTPTVKGTYTKEEGSATQQHLHIDDDQIIRIWNSVKGCKPKQPDAVELLTRLRQEFPDLDILAESKAWAARKLSEPLTVKSKPAAQIWNWMRKAREFTQEKEASHGRAAITNRVPRQYTPSKPFRPGL